MKISKSLFLNILQEEAGQVLTEEITSQQLQAIADKIVKKLDSIDMSMDLVYGALIGGKEATAVTKARQRAFGRAMTPQAAVNELFGFGKKKKEEPESEEDYRKKVEKEIDDTLGKSKFYAKGRKKSDTTAAEEPKSQLEKDVPLSINTRQKGVTAGAGGQREMPLNMIIQKMGLDNRTAQKIAKRIGDYLKQRKIPIAEALEEGFIDSLIKKVVDEVVRTPGASKESKEEFDKKFQQIRDKKAEYAAQVATIEAELQLPDLDKAEYTRLRKAVKTYKQKLRGLDSDLKTMVSAHADFKARTGAEKAEKRKSIRGVGAESGVMGKIVSRFVSDNPNMLKGDSNLQALFDDPAKFAKFVKNIRKNVGRMMKRRGYDEAEIGKLLESLAGEK